MDLKTEEIDIKIEPLEPEYELITGEIDIKFEPLEPIVKEEAFTENEFMNVEIPNAISFKIEQLDFDKEKIKLENDTEIDLFVELNIPNKPKIFKCNVCNKEFSCTRYLNWRRTHMLDHYLKGQVPMIGFEKAECNICGQSFRSLELLQIHMRRWFKCEKCQKCFSTKLKYLKHTRKISHE